MKKVFIYARKSKFKKESESIEVQIEKCQNYVTSLTKQSDDEIPHIEEFKDEGKSGKNLERPDFQRMLLKIRNKECDYVVVYRLDRISRSVSDFSALLNEFDKLNVSFISATENLDTSTPSGKLMIYITSVFAQFEREVIAERVRDNMHALAQSGRWLGGTTPIGFTSTRVKNDNHLDCMERCEYKLEVDENDIEIVHTIFKKYLELQSLTQTKTFLMNNEIKTRSDKYYQDITIKNILRNPVYCIADEKSYQYFSEREGNLCCDIEECDGKHGFIAYNRTASNEKRSKNDIKSWILAVGKHKGIIKSEDWIRIQGLLDKNADKQYRKAHNPEALLSGVLRCKCGHYMRPKYYRENQSGERPYAYMCELKEQSKSQKCKVSNINGKVIDKLICDELLQYDVKGSVVNKQLDLSKEKINNLDFEAKDKLKRLAKQIKEKEHELNNFMDTFNKWTDKYAIKIMEEKIATKGREIETLKQQVSEIKDIDKLQKEIYHKSITIKSALQEFKENFNTLTVAQKREFIRKCVDKAVWDGANLDIFITGSY